MPAFPRCERSDTGNRFELVVPDLVLADNEFIHRALASAQLPSLATQTAQPLITQTVLGGIRLALPPLPEQRAIAAVLDGIDESIERTEEVIAATERLRDALLHELLTRGLPGRHSEWVDVPGLGTAPACWDVVRLGDVCEVTSGYAHGTAAHCPRDHPRPYPTVANVRADQVTVGELLPSHTMELHRRRARLTLAPRGAILS